MARPVPIYRSHEETYTADACTPLVQAVSAGEVKLRALAHGHYPGERLPADSVHGLKTVGYWDAEQPQSWGLPWHRNEGLELTFLETGSLGFAVDGRSWKLESDHLTMTRPWQRHCVGNPKVGAGKLHWLIIDVGVRRPNQEWKWPSWVVLSRPDLNELSGILRNTEQPVWKAEAEIRRCFRSIAKAVDAQALSMLTVRVNELLALTLDLLRRHDTPLDTSLSSTLRTVSLFLEDLRTHPEHVAVDWSVQQMAHSCGLGPTQFIQYVRRLTNMTPLHYLNDCRLKLASALLRDETALSVTDIAVACGFCSSQYFATVFSKRFGCSPREYRLGGYDERLA